MVPDMHDMVGRIWQYLDRFPSYPRTLSLGVVLTTTFGSLKITDMVVLTFATQPKEEVATQG
jgi:hypothetical protein